MSQTITTTYLWFHDSQSDKVYISKVMDDDKGQFVHQTLNGRRFGTLSVKTMTWDTQAKAEAEHEKIVKQKVIKGYNSVQPEDIGLTREGIVVQVPSVVQRDVLAVPMLFEAVTRQRGEELLRDDAYTAQRKMNGVRLRVCCNSDGEVGGINRKGQAVPIAMDIVTSAKAIYQNLQKSFELDGECIGQIFHAFEAVGPDWETQSFEERLRQRDVLCQFADNASIQTVETAFTNADKEALYERAKREEWEGLVLKRREGAYRAGRSNQDFKFKFWNDVTTVLIGTNRTPRAEHGSAIMAILLEDGTRKVVGNVASGFKPGELEKIASRLAQGETIYADVRYLYYDLNALYQPKFERLRTDLTESDAITTRIYGKEGNFVKLS